MLSPILGIGRYGVEISFTSIIHDTGLVNMGIGGAVFSLS